ncbi:low molecular weight protein-tyrosine-phosphatase [Paraburkholderia flagellata]|uniref:low molecular weight protein-tyrosine-phosphatase n=1 Tax=Paraburkholderia flagellata TaxID=2883241 RepID=UPI001F375F76|nr:low molecular weight protein-tyrosine-phosphatase [Paraburkholderia flagellata]
MISSILVLCVGNVCRSPIAEGILRERLPTLHVESAGIGALVGSAAEPHAVLLMAERGIDISSHRARQVSTSLCKEADLILVMDRQQQYIVEQNYTFACGRIYRIGQFADFDVPDPYQGTREQFASCTELIEGGVSEWIDRILAL